MRENLSKSPWKYLGWTIWPILDDETEEIIFYDIHEPGHIGDDDCDSLPNVEMARAEIRRQRKDYAMMNAIERSFGGRR
jgi:hypothetical protein